MNSTTSKSSSNLSKATLNLDSTTAAQRLEVAGWLQSQSIQHRYGYEASGNPDKYNIVIYFDHEIDAMTFRLTWSDKCI